MNSQSFTSIASRGFHDSHKRLLTSKKSIPSYFILYGEDKQEGYPMHDHKCSNNGVSHKKKKKSQPLLHLSIFPFITLQTKVGMMRKTNNQQFKLPCRMKKITNQSISSLYFTPLIKAPFPMNTQKFGRNQQNYQPIHYAQDVLGGGVLTVERNREQIQFPGMEYQRGNLLDRLECKECQISCHKSRPSSRPLEPIITLESICLSNFFFLLASNSWNPSIQKRTEKISNT